MSELNDIEIRFEAVKIAGKQVYTAQGVQSVLFDAQQIYKFVKTGEMPEKERVN